MQLHLLHLSYNKMLQDDSMSFKPNNCLNLAFALIIDGVSEYINYHFLPPH
jgi:hypothetical protein